MTAPPRGILFDLDDTLTDRAASLAAYAVRFQADHGEVLGASTMPDLTAAIIDADHKGYRPRAEIAGRLQALLPWRRTVSVDDLLAHWMAHFPMLNVARDGALATLRRMSALDLRLGIVTNGSVRSQQAKIDRLGFATWCPVVVISEAMGMSKPDPRIFLHASERLGVPAAETWFVGDHPRNDVVGAEQAGMTAFSLQGDEAWPDGLPPPRHAIRRLPELINRLPATRDP